MLSRCGNEIATPALFFGRLMWMSGKRGGGGAGHAASKGETEAQSGAALEPQREAGSAHTSTHNSIPLVMRRGGGQRTRRRGKKGLLCSGGGKRQCWGRASSAEARGLHRHCAFCRAKPTERAGAADRRAAAARAGAQKERRSLSSRVGKRGAWSLQAAASAAAAAGSGRGARREAQKAGEEAPKRLRPCGAAGARQKRRARAGRRGAVDSVQIALREGERGIESSLKRERQTD